MQEGLENEREVLSESRMRETFMSEKEVADAWKGIFS